MTDNNIIEELFTQYAPNVKYEIVESKSFIDSATFITILAAETMLMAFPFLWKIFLVWLERYANGKITIKYKDIEDIEIVVEYSKLTKDEVEKKIIDAYTKAHSKLVKIEFSHK